MVRLKTGVGSLLKRMNKGFSALSTLAERSVYNQTRAHHAHLAVLVDQWRNHESRNDTSGEGKVSVDYGTVLLCARSEQTSIETRPEQPEKYST